MILLIGPVPNPITGVSLANRIIIDNLYLYTKVKVDFINTNYPILKEDIGKFSFSKVFFYIGQYNKINKINKVDKVYITIGQTFFGVLKYYPYFLLSKLLNKEIIVHLHGNHLFNEYKSLRGIKKFIFKKILSMTDKAVVLSNSLRNNFTPFISENKIYVLENFVEDFLYDNVLEKKFEKLRIIYLSNLMKEKGILDLLEALLILKAKNIPFEAKIAGDIDSSMKSIIDKYLVELSNEVDYLGIVYKDEKKELLNWGNIFIFPTYYAMEGQPISIFEAMATGNIILTTKHAGIPDVFQENINGFYIEKQSPTSISNKLIEMYPNLCDYKYISDKNKNESKEKYRVKNFINKLSCILKD